MDEYINKDKVLSMSYCINKPTWDNPYLDPKSVVDVDDIESLPAADVVEVVRCEKCLFYEEVEYYHPTDKNPTKKCVQTFQKTTAT